MNHKSIVIASEAKQSCMSFPRKRESTIVDPRHIFGEERQVLPEKCSAHWARALKRSGMTLRVRLLRRTDRPPYRPYGTAAPSARPALIQAAAPETQAADRRLTNRRLHWKRCLAMTCLLLFIMSSSFVHAASVFQDSNRFAYGVKRVLAAPFQIPAHVVRGTFGGPLVLGTIGGVFTGTFQTIGDLAGGVFDMGAAAAPYAKYAVLA